MPKPAVATDVHKPLDVHRALRAQSTLDLVVPLDLATKSVHIVVFEILRSAIGVDTARIQNLLRPGVADSVDVRERDLNPLSARKIDTGDTCHVLTLTLLMLGIPRANNPQDTLAADDLTVLTDRLYAAADLHLKLSEIRL